jgi:hypothetical protein
MRKQLRAEGGAIVAGFRDGLNAHNEKAGGHAAHGGFGTDNCFIVAKAWIKA